MCELNPQSVVSTPSSVPLTFSSSGAWSVNDVWAHRRNRWSSARFKCGGTVSSPRLAPCVLVFCGKEKEEKDSAGCQSHPGEIFNKYFSLPSHAHARHYLCYTKMCARENAANMQMQKGHRRELASPELKRAGEKRKSNILWTLVLQHRNTETTCKLNKFILFYFSALNFVCSPTFLSPPFFLFGLYRLTKFAFHTCLNLNKNKKKRHSHLHFTLRMKPLGTSWKKLNFCWWAKKEAAQ